MDDIARPPKSSRIHFAERFTTPAIVLAAALTAFREDGTSVLAAAVAAWLCAITALAMSLVHQWDVCPLCQGPPAAVASPQARLRLATRLHRRGHTTGTRAAVVLAAVFVVMPKPYLHDLGWWRPAVAAAYAGAALYLARDLTQVTVHGRHREECPDERCRASRRPTPRPWQSVLAHHGLWIMLVAVPATCALALTAHGRTGLQVCYGTGLLVIAYVLLMVFGHHTDSLCVLCAVRLPDNGSAQAERRGTWLRTTHRTRIAAPIGVGALWVLSWVFAATTAGHLLLALAGLLLVAVLVLNRVHGRLQPWCPWCRDEGGNTHIQTPEPAPAQPLPV
ncbi:hypothetical protein [Streptacidiphilus sp. EB103A]|uniref:hypothetical protein n=1 Tax=Streptacidiphilus sp. EB103A TaxID=3156275 RepID=UPI00351452F8